MKIMSAGVEVGELGENGLISNITDPRLAAIAVDVLQNGIAGVDYVFFEEERGEANPSRTTFADVEYPEALRDHLEELGFDVADLDLEKAAPKKPIGLRHEMRVGLPYGAKKYGPVLDQQIKNSLNFAVQKGVAKWKDGMTQNEMATLFNTQIEKWLDEILARLKPIAWNIMMTGLVAEAVDEQHYSNAHKLAMTYLEDNPYSILNSVKSLGEVQKQEATGVLEKVFKGELPWDINKIRAELMSRADVTASHAELIARTELTKISNLGRILAWEQDPLRDDYNYFWNAVHDEREKSVSKEFEAGNPYTLDQIKALWLNPISPTTGENDSFNQRCNLSRRRKRDV